MGHRALVAYERPDELYNIHYSHNGSLHLRLKQEITSRTPFGGKGTAQTRELLAELVQVREDDALDINRYVAEGDQPETPVTLVPKVTHLTREEILTEHLNHDDHEALYVVSTHFDVTAYRTHWFGLHNVADTVEDSPLFGNGALRTVRWYDGEPVGDGFTQGEFTALKRVVGDLLDRDVFTHEEVVAYLQEKLAEWTDERAELIIRTPSASR